MRVLAIIVNYQTPELTLRAAEGALRELRFIEDGRLVVVDNDSRDGSLEKISEALVKLPGSERAEVIASHRNGGFAFGNNFAIRRALRSHHPPSYVYLLNPDAYPDPGAMGRLVAFMDAHPDVGIAGSYVHGMDGTPHSTAFRFPSMFSEFENAMRLGLVSRALRKWVVAMPIPGGDRDVDWLAGASMMIRREVLETVGLFDERFFLYFEETDLCRRARRQGWRIGYVRESSVGHIGHASTGLGDLTRPMPRYWFDSRRHYFRKNHGAAYLWLSNVARALGLVLWRVRQRIQHKADRDPPGFLRDFVRHSLGVSSKSIRTEA